MIMHNPASAPRHQSLTRRRFLTTSCLSTDVSQIGSTEIRLFITHLQERNVFSNHPYVRAQERKLRDQSVNDYVRALSAVWLWFESEGLIKVNPFTKIKIPGATRTVIVPYTEDQIGALFEVINPKTAVGCRDQAMVSVLADCGFRVSEMCGLTLDNVDLAQRLMKIRGKGGKERFVPLGIKAQRALWHYITQHRPEPASPKFNNLFLTRDGRPLTRRHVGTILRRYSLKVGIPGLNFSPHRFRHSFSIHYLKNGGDVFSLQRILGHSSLDTVRLYVNLASADIQEAHRQYSPLDNFSVRIKRNK